MKKPAKMLRYCTACKQPATHLTTYDAVTGVNIIKDGEALCDACHFKKTRKNKIYTNGTQLKLF